ncbi:MAG: cytidylate kinase-like family protein [Syntrophaceae bacterium]
MQLDRRFCSICAWREHCQRRFIEQRDKFDLHCVNYTRDVTIKDYDTLMVNFQLEKWREAQKKKRPVITISRLTASGGSEIARLLANELKMDLIGGQIINKVAASTKMSTKVVSSLDEKALTRMDNIINSMVNARYLWPDVYIKHLTKVILTIGEHGNSIIMGRGANFILSPDNTFRVRIIAPLESRVRKLMADRKYSKADAEKYIARRDADRAGFIQKYFRKDASDPSNYDMVVNTDKLGIEGSVETIKKSFLEHWAMNRPLIPKISESFVPVRK